MNAKIDDSLSFYAGVERLKITFRYVECKQSLGGVIPKIYVICKCHDKGDAAIKKGLSISFAQFRQTLCSSHSYRTEIDKDQD